MTYTQNVDNFVEENQYKAYLSMEILHVNDLIKKYCSYETVLRLKYNSRVYPLKTH